MHTHMHTYTHIQGYILGVSSLIFTMAACWSSWLGGEAVLSENTAEIAAGRPVPVVGKQVNNGVAAVKNYFNTIMYEFYRSNNILPWDCSVSHTICSSVRVERRKVAMQTQELLFLRIVAACRSTLLSLGEEQRGQNTAS